MPTDATATPATSQTTSQASGTPAAKDGTQPEPNISGVAPTKQPATTLVGDAPKQEVKQEAKKDTQSETQKTESDKAQASSDVEVKLPEGVEADAKLLDGFKQTAKDLGLKSEQAQKLVDVYVKAQAESIQKLEEARTQQVKQWAEDVKADKDLGGAKLNETLAHAQKAVQYVGGDEFRQWLNETGLGNHPMLVRAFSKFGQALKEDSIAGRSAPAARALSPEERVAKFYDDMPKK